MPSPLAGEGLGGGRSNAVVRNPNANRPSLGTANPSSAGHPQFDQTVALPFDSTNLYCPVQVSGRRQSSATSESRAEQETRR
jgi:hypothetical protein